jgi:hypothetical protein
MNRVKIKTILNKIEILYIKILKNSCQKIILRKIFYKNKIIIRNYYKKILLISPVYPWGSIRL